MATSVSSTSSAATATNANGANYNITGAISGLDDASIIQAMLAVEKAPLTTIANQQTALQSQQTAWEQLRTLLTTLDTKVQQFTVWNQGGARAATSSNTSVLTASSGSNTVAGTYQVTVNQLATDTVATSTAAMGRQLTSADLGTALTSLPLPGTVSSGTTGIVVDGTIVHATIDGSGTLGDALTAMQTAIQAQLQQTDPTATVTASISGNRVSFAVSGATSAHSVAFGAGGDTSNAAAIFGLTGVSSTTYGTSTGSLSGTSALGVAQAAPVLDQAGLSASMAAASTGTLSVNGAQIAYDTSKDSLTSIITKINSSAAGVVASLDRTNDKLVLTSKTGGATPITIQDTGPLAAALNLATDSTAGQTLGQQASITIDGRTYTSDTDTFSNALDGIKISVLSKGTSTLTISPDATATTTAAQGVVDAYNALADALDTMTANGANATQGPLADNSSVRDLALSLRSTIMGFSSAGSFTSLADLGISTGAIGSKVGTTTRLQLDTTKLSDAITSDPNAVATLFSSIMKPLDTSIRGWTDYGKVIDSAEQDITSQLTDLSNRQTDVNQRVAIRQAALEAQFAQMESTLAQLQTTTNSLANTVAQQNKSSTG